jgi:hypothetical protein
MCYESRLICCFDLSINLRLPISLPRSWIRTVLQMVSMDRSYTFHECHALSIYHFSSVCVLFVCPNQTFSWRTVGILRKNSFREERSSGRYRALQSIHMVW